jgi:hypothetical protein
VNNQELNMTLQQQQVVMDDLAASIGSLRQHVARTRYNVADHPDVDRIEDDVQRLTVRWENVCSQVLQRCGVHRTHVCPFCIVF